jgi:SMC interacting uncharacterized protein involved in chromosome segregation
MENNRNLRIDEIRFEKNLLGLQMKSERAIIALSSSAPDIERARAKLQSLEAKSKELEDELARLEG